MEAENLSIDELTISFEETQDFDSKSENDLSTLLLSARSDGAESRIREDNGRGKNLTTLKPILRAGGIGASQSAKSNSGTYSPVGKRRFSVPRYCPSPPILPGRRSSEPQKLGIEQFVAHQKESEQQRQTTGGSSRQSSTSQLLSGVAEDGQESGRSRLFAAMQTDTLARGHNCSERSFARDQRLPPLENATTRNYAAPSSHVPADTLPTRGRRRTLSPLGAPSTKSEFPMNFPLKTQARNGRESRAPGGYVSAKDFEIPFTAKLTEHLETELCLLKGQNPIEKKRSRYGLEGQSVRDIGTQGLWSGGEPHPHNPGFTNQAIRCRSTPDMFDAMFEA